jgi:hypothetical protein
VAWDLDNAVTLKLMQFDNAQKLSDRKFFVSVIHGSEKAEEIFRDEEDLIHGDLMAMDPYADANTQVW